MGMLKKKPAKLLLVNAGWQGSVGATSSRRGFAANTDFLHMQSKSFRLHRTERANNQIKQGNAVFFARNPIGPTYNQLPAMFTRTFHNSPLSVYYPRIFTRTAYPLLETRRFSNRGLRFKQRTCHEWSLQKFATYE